MVDNIHNESKKIWFSQIGADEFPKIPDLQVEFEVRKRLLSLTQFGDGYFFISNLKNDYFDYVSPSIQKVLGYEAASMDSKTFINLIHPEDQLYFLNFQARVADFYKELTVEKIDKYKIQYDYRIKTKSCGYKRILHQLLVLHYDEQKVFYRTLVVHSDITHIKYEGIPAISMIGMGDEPSFFNVETALLFGNEYFLFSKREKQILKLIVQGKKSSEISKILFISLHTVNAHRKNILQKAKAKSPSELVTKAIMQGWL